MQPDPCRLHCVVDQAWTRCDWHADGHSDFLAACKARAEGKLHLEHSYAEIGDDKLCHAEGPYDVVVLDMNMSQLVLALMQVSYLCQCGSG